MRLVAAGEQMAWDEASGTCRGVNVGLRVDILTAAVGAVAAPQSKVQFARAVPVVGDWQFPSAAAATARPFGVHIDVRFVSQAQAVDDVVRSLPPLRSFPEDLFFPFTA